MTSIESGGLGLICFMCTGIYVCRLIAHSHIWLFFWFYSLCVLTYTHIYLYHIVLFALPCLDLMQPSSIEGQAYVTKIKILIFNHAPFHGHSHSLGYSSIGKHVYTCHPYYGSHFLTLKFLNNFPPTLMRSMTSAPRASICS